MRTGLSRFTCFADPSRCLPEEMLYATFCDRNQVRLLLAADQQSVKVSSVSSRILEVVLIITPVWSTLEGRLFIRTCIMRMTRVCHHSCPSFLGKFATVVRLTPVTLIRNLGRMNPVYITVSTLFGQV